MTIKLSNVIGGNIFIALTVETVTQTGLVGVAERLRVTPLAGKRLLLISLTTTTNMAMTFEKSLSGVVFSGQLALGFEAILGQVDEEFVINQTAIGFDEDFTLTYYTEV